MNKRITSVLQIAAVFIGTIVGAGLASGQEICQFFTCYGIKSFIGIFLCLIIYVLMGILIINLSINFKLNSYNALICLVSPGFLGKMTSLITTAFLICGSGIILAGSGALIHQYFNFPKWVGIFIMAITALVILLRDTKGLIEINSIIVPCLIIIIIILFFTYIFNKGINIIQLFTIPHYKNNWFFSSLIYGGFNVLCCTGVLVPMAEEVKKKGTLIYGIILGALGLTILTSIINLLLLLSAPSIFKFEIPLLFVAKQFNTIMQLSLLFIIWFEMLSTIVSDIYSVSKTLTNSFNISYKSSVILIILISIPISQLGFVKLISLLYPAFAVISFIFMIQCVYFYCKNRRKVI